MHRFKPWTPLKKDSIIDIIAPAGGQYSSDTLSRLQDLLKTWELTPRISPDLFGEDLLSANSDEKRFQQLKDALISASSKAIWCLRGGYGCIRLIPSLFKIKKILPCKLFIGFSDITALHLFLQKSWSWQTVHGPTVHQALHLSNPRYIEELKKLIFGELKQLQYSLCSYNNVGSFPIKAPLVGGNLTLVQTSIGTPWQIETKNKILLLEEVNERGYHIDRMLQHLSQSGLFKEIKALLFGHMIFSKEKTEQETKLIQAVLTRFAREQSFPVLYCSEVGHGKINRSLPLGAPALLSLDNNRGQLSIPLSNLPC